MAYKDFIKFPREVIDELDSMIKSIENRKILSHKTEGSQYVVLALASALAYSITS